MSPAEAQREWARDLANHIRHQTSIRREHIGDLSQGDGLRYVADLLADRPGADEILVRGSDPTGAMRIHLLLASPLRMGPSRARRLMAAAGFYRPQARVRDLTERERMALVVQLHKYAAIADGAERLAA